MGMFTRKAPELAAEVEPFSRWSIRTELADGRVFDLIGHVYGDSDHAEAVRYIEAIRDGLTDAGFTALVSLTREVETEL